jgi:hypothetical protein
MFILVLYGRLKANVNAIAEIHVDRILMRSKRQCGYKAPAQSHVAEVDVQ